MTKGASSLREFSPTAWSELDTPERQAARVFSQCSWQADLFQEWFDKGKHRVTPRLLAADRVMDWLSIPVTRRLDVWTGVQVLSDLKHQQGREATDQRICFHAEDPLVLVREDCWRCQVAWKCGACDAWWSRHPWHECA